MQYVGVKDRKAVQVLSVGRRFSHAACNDDVKGYRKARQDQDTNSRRVWDKIGQEWDALHKEQDAVAAELRQMQQQHALRVAMHDKCRLEKSQGQKLMDFLEDLELLMDTKETELDALDALMAEMDDMQVLQQAVEADLHSMQEEHANRVMQHSLEQLMDALNHMVDAAQRCCPA